MYRRAHAGDHVLALGVHQELAVELLLAGGGIAGKAHAGAAGLAHVAEDHGLDVNGGSQPVVDVVDAAVVPGAVIVPTAEDGIARHHQLFARLLREVDLGELLNHLLVLGDHFLQRLGVQLGVELDLLLLLLVVEDFLEVRLLDFQHHVAEHLDEAAIGVVGEARVVGPPRQGFHRFIVQAEVEDGVHHAGHGELGAGAHRNQQRIFARAQLLPLQLLQTHQRLVHLAVNCRRQRAAHPIAAGFRLDGEPRRNRQASVGHFGQPGALASKLILHFAVSLGFSPAEEVNVLYCAFTGSCHLRALAFKGMGTHYLTSRGRFRRTSKGTRFQSLGQFNSPMVSCSA